MPERDSVQPALTLPLPPAVDVNEDLEVDVDVDLDEGRALLETLPVKQKQQLSQIKRTLLPR